MASAAGSQISRLLMLLQKAGGRSRSSFNSDDDQFVLMFTVMTCTALHLGSCAFEVGGGRVVLLNASGE